MSPRFWPAKAASWVKYGDSSPRMREVILAHKHWNAASKQGRDEQPDAGVAEELAEERKGHASAP